MPHSHSRAGCHEQHDEKNACSHSHAHESSSNDDGSASVSGGHSHSGGADAAGSSKAPCDFCSSLQAHSQVKKQAQRAEARQRQEAQRDGTDGEEEQLVNDDDEEEEEEDERARLVLPAQRISLPLMSPRIKQAVLAAFAIAALKVLRDVLVARRSVV